MSVELFTLLRGLTGVTVRIVEDGFDERSPETPWATRGGVTLLDLGEVVSRVDTSGDEICGVIAEVHCSKGVGRRTAAVGGGGISGCGFMVVRRANRDSF